MVSALTDTQRVCRCKANSALDTIIQLQCKHLMMSELAKMTGQSQMLRKMPPLNSLSAAPMKQSSHNYLLYLATALLLTL